MFHISRWFSFYLEDIRIGSSMIYRTHVFFVSKSNEINVKMNHLLFVSFFFLKHKVIRNNIVVLLNTTIIVRPFAEN